MIGILVAFSNNFGAEMNVGGTINPGKAIMFAYVAISIGDILIGFVSHWLKSRKKALYIFYGLTILAIAFYFTQDGGSAN
ncbi:hypothetical protein, partial [Streptomyces sp. GSL17-113]|uniref:hypothetical protein n=1 Tax=Streptomyces sp. GSL17-113 TaxID=3115365 RepID=UPI002E7A2920